MFSEVRKRSRKAGQPPGTLTYTGKKNIVPTITVLSYNEQNCQEKTGKSLQECLSAKIPDAMTTWIHLEGLRDISILTTLAEMYRLHPLTVEDILNVGQRPKIEEFDHYIYVTLKVLFWNNKKKNFSMSQLSLVLGEDFVLTFSEGLSNLFDGIRERIRSGPQLGLQKKSSDYLTYRLIDLVVDNYFVVLEGLGDQIEKVEDLIVANPVKQTAKSIYRLKRQMLVFRKATWPTRDIINHFFKLEGKLISTYTHVYFRDVYDHIAQAIDTIEMFRDMLSNMLDIYLSSLTNRMNEIIKVLTIFATIFMPITFIASIYGMNFHDMPELQWKWGYPAVLIFMLLVVACMLVYFRIKKWW